MWRKERFFQAKPTVASMFLPQTWYTGDVVYKVAFDSFLILSWESGSCLLRETNPVSEGIQWWQPRLDNLTRVLSVELSTCCGSASLWWLSIRIRLHFDAVPYHPNIHFWCGSGFCTWSKWWESARITRMWIPYPKMMRIHALFAWRWRLLYMCWSSAGAV